MRQFKRFFAVGAVVAIGTVTIAMSSTAVAVAPSNDNFDDAPSLVWDTSGGAHVFGLTGQTTVDATMETGEPTGITDADTMSVWFLWTNPTGLGHWDNQEFKVVTTSQDLTLNVYTGIAVNALTPVTGDNDGVGVPYVNFSSPGNAYWIRVASMTGYPTNFNLVWGTSINATAPVWGPISAKIAGSTATVTFSATASAPVIYTCNLDNAGPSSCTSPTAFVMLSKGPHSLVLTATVKLVPADNGAATTAPALPITIKSGKFK
jgi:hypothetical protein